MALTVAAAPREAERPPIGEPILVVDGLQKHFGGLHVTNNVSFSLRQGEILGLIGLNGAGKTTVFNMISGFLKQDSGSVTQSGARMASFGTPLTPMDFAAIGVGRTFRSFSRLRR